MRIPRDPPQAEVTEGDGTFSTRTPANPWHIDNENLQGPALACISASITTATRPPTSRLAIPLPPCALPACGKEPRHSTRPAPWPSGRAATWTRVDPATEEGRLTVMSYVWPDQRDRLAALRGALEVAARVPAKVERADAADWLAAKLAQPARGVATVVFQSIVWQYLSVEDQERVRRTIEEGGSRATSDMPLAWLRFEPSADRMCCEVRLRSWPGRSDDRLLATAGYHGRPVRWLA